MSRVELSKVYDDMIASQRNSDFVDCEGNEIRMGKELVTSQGRIFRCMEFNPIHGLGLKSRCGKKVYFWKKSLIRMHELRLMG